MIHRSWILTIVTSVAFSLGTVANRSVAQNAYFYPIVDIEAVLPQDGSYFPVQNLIQGPDIGFDSLDPFDALLFGSSGTWVTDACGFPCDYLDSFDPPALVIDLGEDVPLDQIDIWGYEQSNANGVAEFSLRFATDAEGTDGFGTSIDYNPTFFGFTQRYAEPPAIAI